MANATFMSLLYAAKENADILQRQRWLPVSLNVNQLPLNETLSQ